jgi:hypothetical protein
MEPTAMTCVAEKEGKYVASWTPRYLRFSSLTRELSYTADTNASCITWKQTMTVHRITRVAETKRFDPGSYERKDILIFTVSGVVQKDKMNATLSPLDDVEQADMLPVPTMDHAAWVFRFMDDETFFQWWSMIREALVANGLMRDIDGGLPRLDFRYQIPYARVPLELLFFFKLLDTAVFFFIDAGNLVFLQKLKNGGGLMNAVTDGALVVGDTTIYVLQQDGMIVRWIEVASVSRLHCGPDFIVIETAESNADIVFRFHGFFSVEGGARPTAAETVRRCCDIVSSLALLQNTSGSNVEVLECPSADLAEYLPLQKLRYIPPQDFPMDHVTCPQSKAKLCAVREQLLRSSDLPADPSSPLLSPPRLKAKSSKRSLLTSSSLSSVQQPQLGTPPSPAQLAADQSLSIPDDIEADFADLDSYDDGLDLQLSLVHAVHGNDDHSAHISLDDI